MLIAVSVLAIMVRIALPRVSLNRYRMDGAARLVQTVLTVGQQTAIQRGAPVLVIGDASASPNRLEIVVDANGDGSFTLGERRQYRALPEGAVFLAPGSTVDGATAAIATGSGVTFPATARWQVTFSPGGGATGDAVVYLGTSSTRDDDRRAVGLTGATARTRFWRRRDGSWRPDQL